MGLLKSAEMPYDKNNYDWILQENNEPMHRRRLCTQWKEENCIVTLNWTPQSPDANRIANA